MLFVLSPAKALDYESPVPAGLAHSQPVYAARAAELIGVLRKLSPQQLAELMKLSDALAQLNVARYQAWSAQPDVKQARQAVLAFNGDVYEGLQARSLTAAETDWLQAHVCILSGLYGALRPLDLIQPHRLEMGTRLGTAHGSNLYQFWGALIAEHLNQRLQEQGDEVLVNLASQEYFKSVDRKRLKARVVECVFEDEKDGRYRVISFYAKRARGLMVRHAAQVGARTPEQLKDFDLDGYVFAAAASETDRLVFRRSEAARA